MLKTGPILPTPRGLFFLLPRGRAPLNHPCRQAQRDVGSGGLTPRQQRDEPNADPDHEQAGKPTETRDRWRCVGRPRLAREIDRRVDRNREGAGREVPIDSVNAIERQRSRLESHDIRDSAIAQCVAGWIKESIRHDVVRGGHAGQIREALGRDDDPAKSGRARQVIGKGKARGIARDRRQGHQDLSVATATFLHLDELDRPLGVAEEFGKPPKMILRMRREGRSENQKERHDEGR